MAKITLKSFEEFIVPETKAREIYEHLEEKRQEENNGGLPLSAWPITIEHQDGMWVGNLSNLGPISMSDKVRKYKHTFQSEEDIQRFHRDYGYGAFQTINQKGYGLLDVQTQFLIKTGQARIEGSQLVMLNAPHKEKWNDLWSIYQSKLDQFYEI